MKRIILLAFLVLPRLAYSQYRANCFKLNSDATFANITVNLAVNQDTTIDLNIKTPIYGFAVSGRTVLGNDNDSYVRIILKDSYNFEHMVYECFPMLADSLAMQFQQTAMETIALDGVTPQSIRIMVKNATVKLDSYQLSTKELSKQKGQSSLSAILEQQNRYVVGKLNENLEKHNKTWKAGTTSVSQLTYEEKKDMFGGRVPLLYGFEYYKGGIFVMTDTETAQGNMNMRSNTSEQYVSEWDWRDRHGKWWMSPVKFQGHCNACWAFTATGVLESYINLYYNQLINYHLSELEILSCTDRGCRGGLESMAFDYILDNGIVKDECFHFNDTLKPCSLKCQNPAEKIFIDEYLDYTVSESQMKELLFKAPMTIGFSRWEHSMVLAGYKLIENGDLVYDGNTYDIDSVVIDENIHQNLIGRTAWLIKNSWGETWGDLGYAYVLVNNNHIDTHCYLNGRITSNIYYDSDIICEDADGDGYYFWGLGNKPAHCPSWVPDTPDGDDSNINYGPLDNYGYLQVLSPNGETVDTCITYSSDTTITKRIGIVKNGVLTITGTTIMTGDAKIRVCENGTLIVDGGTIQNANLELVPGCHLIVRNNGTINMASGLSFDAPVGAIIDIDEGIIN